MSSDWKGLADLFAIKLVELTEALPLRNSPPPSSNDLEII